MSANTNSGKIIFNYTDPEIIFQNKISSDFKNNSRIKADYSSSTYNLLFEIRNNDTTYTEILKMNSSGLDISGNITVSGTVDGVDIANLASTALTTIPTASSTTLGGVKVGTNLSIDENGVLSASGGASGTITGITAGTGLSGGGTSGGVTINLDEATSTELGGIKVGTNLSMTDGVLSATNTTYNTATDSALGLIKIGYTENDKNYPVELTDGKAFVNVPWTDTNTTYSEATNSALGLIKIGYTESGKNYPVELSDGKAFVNVPWVNTTYTVGDGGLTQNNFTDALKADVENAVLRTGDQTIGGNKTFSNNVIVTGDLTVNGTNTVINSTVLTVNDQHIVINDGGDDTSANGGGIILEGTSANKTILYDNTNTSWDFSEHVNLASGKEFKIADTSEIGRAHV